MLGDVCAVLLRGCVCVKGVGGNSARAVVLENENPTRVMVGKYYYYYYYYYCYYYYY